MGSPERKKYIFTKLDSTKRVRYEVISRETNGTLKLGEKLTLFKRLRNIHNWEIKSLHSKMHMNPMIHLTKFGLPRKKYLQTWIQLNEWNMGWFLGKQTEHRN